MARRSLGESYEPLGTHRNDPFGLYRQARREEPVFHSAELGGWVVTRYDDVRQVLRDPETFSSANAIPMPVPPSPAAIAELEKGFPVAPVPTNADGEAHRRLRAAMAPAFTPERVAATEPFIRERAEALVDGFIGQRQADFMARYANVLPVEVVTVHCGLGLECAPVVQTGGTAIVALVGTPMGEAEQAAAAREFVALQQLIAAAIRERRDRPTGDLISQMVAALAPGSGPLSFEQETELVNNVAEVLIPGHITLTRTLGNGLRALLEHREQWERLVEQPELVPGAADEVLRLGTPMAGQGRITTRPVTMGGVELPAGTPLVVMFDAANRDETRFDRPELPEVTRRPNRHLTFGLGAHFCVGAGLARTEVAITLQTLTRRLPGLRLADGQQVQIAPVYQLRGPEALQVTW